MKTDYTTINLVCNLHPMNLNLRGENPQQHDFLTFTHYTGELSRNVTVWDGCDWRVSIAGGWVVGLEAFWSRLFFCSCFWDVWRGSGVVWGRLGCTERTVGLNWCDDDLLKLLEGIAQVSPFQNVLTRGQCQYYMLCKLFRKVHFWVEGGECK